ncbi:zinc metalloproteinase-disintegrin-like MTP4 isoform X2 [Engraulis encrasicolus]|uniref:zinc metalloproteinase-disintegrin-like MTP4 isoform X2 n=1 Tax=Engraulis encrasicolus TaxID=184585 RepID=UPI002FD171FC
MRYMWTVFLTVSISVATGDFVRQLPNVAHYEVVRPLRLNGRHKRSLSQGDGTKRYPDELWYELHFAGRNHTVHLEKNRLLIGRNFSETHYNQDGTSVTTLPFNNNQSLDHCYYHGYIQDLEDSSVSVGICSGISGVLRARQQVYLIEPLGAGVEGEHAVYRPEHLKGTGGASNTTEGRDNAIPPRVARVYHPSGQRNMPRFDKPRYVQLYLVVDKTEYERYQTLENVRERMLQVAHLIDSYYRPVKIRVLLVGMEVWTAYDKFPVSISEDQTLTDFLKWLNEGHAKKVHFDNAHFVTGIDFLGETVGLANKFAMCSERSGGVNQDYHESAYALAGTIAHEMGHNLGMSHDEPGCYCGPDYESKCLMLDTVNKHSIVFPSLFSDCSLKQLSDFLNSPAIGCLDDPPQPDSLYGGALCGNGVLDSGEQCDCGPAEDCNNPCCDASTCHFTDGSECAEGGCCENCQLKPPGSVCRAAAHDCDLEEYCTASGTCPEDSFKMNGALCNYGDGYCYNGLCPSATSHCKRLWGPDARSPPECFHRNMRGDKEAHCGYDRYRPRPCSDRDMMCGKLFCHGDGFGEKDPVTGQEKRHPFTGRGGNWPGICYFLQDLYDPGNQYGMVPTGTKCGLNRVCYNYKCQDVEVYGNKDCSAKCSSHGVCNHKGECHCDPGWAGPNCNSKEYNPPGNGVIIGVCAAGAVILLLALLVGGARFWKKGKPRYFPCKKKSQPGKLTPAQSQGRADSGSGGRGETQLSQPLNISQPVFLETTSKRMDSPSVIPIAPCRPAPLPPQNSPRLSSQGSSAHMRPTPPPKPSPAVPAKLFGAGKAALRPPTMPRR